MDDCFLWLCLLLLNASIRCVGPFYSGCVIFLSFFPTIVFGLVVLVDLFTFPYL